MSFLDLNAFISKSVAQMKIPDNEPIHLTEKPSDVISNNVTLDKPTAFSKPVHQFDSQVDLSKYFRDGVNYDKAEKSISQIVQSTELAKSGNVDAARYVLGEKVEPIIDRIKTTNSGERLRDNDKLVKEFGKQVITGAKKSDFETMDYQDLLIQKLSVLTKPNLAIIANRLGLRFLKTTTNPDLRAMITRRQTEIIENAELTQTGFNQYLESSAKKYGNSSIPDMSEDDVKQNLNSIIH